MKIRVVMKNFPQVINNCYIRISKDVVSDIPRSLRKLLKPCFQKGLNTRKTQLFINFVKKRKHNIFFIVMITITSTSPLG